MSPKAATKAKSRNVTLTHPDRLYWPADGVTKEGLADYYAEVWRSSSPMSSNGRSRSCAARIAITGQTFFQKHVWKG